MQGQRCPVTSTPVGTGAAGTTTHLEMAERAWPCRACHMTGVVPFGRNGYRCEGCRTTYVMQYTEPAQHRAEQSERVAATPGHVDQRAPASVFDATFTERVRCAVVVLGECSTGLSALGSTLVKTDDWNMAMVRIAKEILRGDGK